MYTILWALEILAIWLLAGLLLAKALGWARPFTTLEDQIREDREQERALAAMQRLKKRKRK